MSLIRGLDSQRRLTIPQETLRSIGAEPGDLIKIYGSVTPDGDSCVVVRKHEPGCTFCGDPTESHIRFEGKRICHECLGCIVEEGYNADS